MVVDATKKQRALWPTPPHLGQRTYMLTTEQAQRLLALEERFRRERAARGLLNFITYTKPNYDVSWHHRVMARKLNDVAEGRCKRLIITMPPRHGKACAHDTVVWTTDGWKTHGDLAVGDFVFAPDGKPTRVVAVGADTTSSYRLTFTNGEAVECHADHEWTVTDRSCHKLKTLTTHQLSEQPLSIGPAKSRARFLLPHVSPLQTDAVPLPLDPYLLGAWLGDGTTSSPCLTHAYSERAVIDSFIAAGYDLSVAHVHQTTGVVTSSFAGPQSTGVGSSLVKALVATGVYKRKIIPLRYLTAGTEQRRELLAGLIDTDGSCDTTGRYVLSNTNAALAEQTATLARSLGGRVQVQSYPSVVSSSVVFHLPVPLPCRLPRKQFGKPSARRRIAIKSIERCHPKPARCIQVDRPDGLYLVGKKMVPTHNSEQVSVRFPAYVLGRDPKAQIIAASYNATLARKMNRAVQRVIDSPVYEQIFPGTRLNSKNIVTSSRGSWLRNADEFEVVEHGGSYRSTGVGGSATGYGLTIGIIDDYCKNRKDASSALQRDALWDWYTSTFYTRLEKEGAIVICATRWHEDELIGRLLERAQKDPDADQWEVLNLPAICEGDGNPLDPRSIGDALWPNKYNEKRLARTKAVVGEKDWSSIYQQRPSPAEGDIVKRAWWRFYTELPAEFDQMCISADLNLRESKTSDFTVMQVWGRSGQSYYLLDQVRARMGWNLQKRALPLLMTRWPELDMVLIEDAANGAALVEEMQSLFPSVLPIRPKGSKTLRLSAVAPMIEAGNVYLPDPKAADTRWVEDLIAEVATFPNGKHDDMVDCISLGLSGLKSRSFDYDFVGESLPKSSTFT